MANPRFDAWVISAVLNKLYERHRFESTREGARFLHMHKDTIARWLRGETQQYDPPKVQGVALRLGATPEMAQQLFDIAVQTHLHSASGYHEAANPGAGPGQTPFTLIEAGADRIDIYEDNLITGLLQHPDYIRALAEADPFSDPEHAERVLKYKLERQAAIFGAASPEMRIVMNEQALLRIAKFDFYEAQIAHMLDLIERYGIGVYVLPIEAGICPASYGSFIVMGFSNPLELDIAFLESYGTAGEWVEDRHTLDRFRTLFKSTLRRCVELGAYANADRGMAQVQP